MIFRILIISFFTLFSPLYPKATFNPDVTVNDLIEKIQGKGVTISNATISKGLVGGDLSQVATFSNGFDANLSIDKGILLTTGSAINAFNMNTDGNTSVAHETTSNNITWDDVILEFDIKLDKGVYLLEVDYQFASEEYPEFVGSRYNDLFSFNLSGGDLNKAYNIARANDKPVSITTTNINNYSTVNVNNINNGKRGDDGDTNPINKNNTHMFIDNGGRNPVLVDENVGTYFEGWYLTETYPIDPNDVKIISDFDGFTTKLYAIMDNLTPLKTYHFKMHIADMTDPGWDSGVFISKIRAYSGGGFTISDATATEGDDLKFIVKLDRNQTTDITINFSTEDVTATKNVDFLAPNPLSVVFKAGESSKTIHVPTVSDSDTEDNETMKLIGTVADESNKYLLIDTASGTGTILDYDDSGINSNSVIFNVERTNTKGTSINAARFPLYTQISGRPFDYDVVVYNAEMTEEFPIENVVLKIDLYPNEGNESISVDTQYVYFGSSNSRARIENITIDGAYKDVRFAVTAILKNNPEGNGTIYKLDCEDKTAEICYTDLYDDGNISRHEDQTDAKDNFAIRPAALYYAIDDDNTSVRYLENNLTGENKKFIAGHEYSLYIRGLSYGSSIDLMDSYNGETNATLAYDAESGTNCSDESNSSFLADGNTTTSFKHSEVGIYTLGLIDDSWTEVDQNDNEDCVVGNAATPKEFNTPPGCNISSDATANSVSNQTFAYVPAKFDLSGISRSIRLGAGKIDNNDTVYMNDLYGAQTPMSIEIAGIIQALAEDDNITVNYTERCRAENLNFSFDLSALATDDINTTVNFDNFLTEDGNRQLVQYNFINIDPDDPKIEGNENNYTIDTPNVNRTTITLDANISADNFRSADTNITLNLNINRNRLEAMNPKRIVFNSIDVNSSEDSNNVHNREINGTNTGLGETTLLYAKVRASQEKYTASASDYAQNTPIQIEVYCTDPTNGGECINPDGTSKHGLRNDDTSSGWWLSTLEGTLNNATDINLTVTNKEFKLNDEDDVVNATNIVVRIPNTTVTADGDMGNTNNANNGLVFTVCPNAIPAFTDVNTTKSSPWVRYGADPLYSLNCQGASDWSGVGNVGSVVGGAGGGAGQAPAVDTHTNDRLSW
ncbi:MAG: choice-of-anchor L domain-containing protein [Campylobacterota bacterium]|nr:choice-of-anchor L domain-containing protein [Campylobacterota bacterium]